MCRPSTVVPCSGSVSGLNHHWPGGAYQIIDGTSLAGATLLSDKLSMLRAVLLHAIAMVLRDWPSGRLTVLHVR